jgi:hypothetical protein
VGAQGSMMGSKLWGCLLPVTQFRQGLGHRPHACMQACCSGHTNIISLLHRSCACHTELAPPPRPPRFCR